jgi:oligoendopeptidase F
MDIKDVPERESVPDEFKWDLLTVYDTDEAWSADLDRMKKLIPHLRTYKGRLKDDPSGMAKCIHDMDDIERSAERIFTYSHLKHDSDLRVTKYQEMHERAEIFAVSLSEATSYMVPEILSSSEDVLNSLLDHPDLEFARVVIREVLRNRTHYLDENSELLLAMGSKATGVASTAFRMLNDADLRFGTVKDGDGNDHELTHGRFGSMLMDGDRELRKSAFMRLHTTYETFGNTFTALLDGEMESRRYHSRVRRFPSSLEASLNTDEVPPRVFRNIISAVKESLPDLHSYVRMRKDALGLNEIHPYDLYVPLVQDLDRSVPYPEACSTVLKAVEPMGHDFKDITNEFFTHRWIDVYENKGKRSGAYSSGSYDTPPYILMNYDDKVKDLFTLAHEMGHSIHSRLSNITQPHIQADYPILIGEVASNVNEALLSDLLMRTWKGRKERAFLMTHELEEMRTSVFRQCLFAEFEEKVSSLVDSGEPLTKDLLCEIYSKMNAEYYGPDLVIDPPLSMEWARIPHFYLDFYVYKYVTGYCCARSIAKRVLEGDHGTKDGYLALLRSGGSLPPLEALKLAGIDLGRPDPIREALSSMGKTISDLRSAILHGE